MFFNAQRYPTRRKSEFYCQPFPNEYRQSRQAEHPTKSFQTMNINKLKQNAIFESFTLKTTRADQRIRPPTSSDTRVARDSYFS